MASEISKPRYVRCPRCRRLLMEIADIPVYKCGGCGTILQAKTRRANTEIGHRGCHVEENPPCSTSENNWHEEESNNLSEEGPSACQESADVGAGSTADFPDSAGRSAAMGVVDTVSVAFAPQSQLDGSCKPSRLGSANSSSSCKMAEFTESAVSEEEMFDADPGKRQVRNVGTSIARSSHAYEGGVSSGDDISGKHERYRLLSRRTFKNRQASEPSVTGRTDGKEDTFVGNRQASSPDGMCDTGALSISGLERGSSSRNAAHSSDPDASPGSENLYPAQSEEESDHPSSRSRSPSRDSTSLEDFPCNSSNSALWTGLRNLQVDHLEPPRSVGLLGDQHTRTYAGGQRGDRRVSAGGNRHDSHRPRLFSNPGSELVPTALCNGDMPQWQSRASGRKTTPQGYQTSGIPFSANGIGSCLPPRYHPQACDIHVQEPSSIHCRAYSSHTWFHPPTAATSGCPDDGRDAALCHSGETSDHHTGKLPSKEKQRHHRKRRQCRPVSGGAPFVVCNNCLQLLQLPVDFLVSRARRHKLRCGACSEVLTFLYNGGHVIPDTSAQMDPSTGKAPCAMGDAVRGELSAHQSHDGPHEDPVSYSEEYGPPPSQSYSTDGEPCTLRSSPEQKGKGRSKQRMGPSLHHLLGYVSARDLMFVPGAEDEIYESVDLSRFRRRSDDIDFEGYGRSGKGSPAQERSPARYSPNHSGIHKEEEPVMRLANSAREGPPPRGFIRGYADELNQGLDTLKLRSHKNGGPW